MQNITVRIDGGLGNQLFQYAAGYALSKRLGVPLKLDLAFFDIKYGGPQFTVRNFLLDKFNVPALNVATKENISQEVGQYETWKTKIKSIKFIYASWFVLKKIPLVRKAINFIKRPQQVQNQDNHIFVQYSYLPVDSHFFEMTDKSYTYGSFMSELYFKQYENDIRQIFTLKDPISSSAQKSLEEIKNTKCAVSFHVRRGDYVTRSDIVALNSSTSLDYYKQAAKLMQKIHGDDVHFFAFSDDPQYIKDNFDFIPNKTVITGDTEYPHEDLYLMSQCDHHIIANSTFSWWGAWLNPNKDKTVITPRWWYARETMKTHNTMDVIPEGWIIL